MAGSTTAFVDLVWGYGYDVLTERMDTLHIIFVSWAIFGILFLALAKFLYGKFLCGTEEEAQPPTEGGLGEDESNQNKPEVTSKSDRKLPKIVPEYLPPRLIPPVATGEDPDAVRWINEVFIWLYEGSEGTVIKEAWNDSLNELTVNTALETGVLIEVLEVLPATPAPQLSSIVIDCQPNDDMTLTCDVTADVYIRVQATRTQRDVTIESEYACAIVPMRGRLNGEIKPYKASCDLSLVGWPEVNVKLEGTRNNSEGLDESQLQEVVKEVLVNSIRCVQVVADFNSSSSFPRFRRARDAPDRVIPVGYDALVREAQTHPPATPHKAPALNKPSPFPVPSSSRAKSPNFQVPKDTKSSMGAVPSQNQSILVSTPNKVSDAFLKPYNTRQRSESGSTDEEVIEIAGESFTSLMIPSSQGLSRSNPSSGRASPHLSPGSGRASPHLTPSEESLINRTVNRGGSPNPIQDESWRNLSPSPERGRARIDMPSKAPPVPKRRSASRSPPRRGVKGPSLTHRKEPQPQNEEEDYDYTDSGSLQQTWRSLPQKSEEDEDSDGESLKRILQNAQSFKSSRFGHNQSSQDMEPSGYVGLAGKRLLVKIVRAANIGGEKEVHGSYVVVEMDDPSQKFTTNVCPNESCPVWEEQFLFELSENTLEILFEVFDKNEERFMGLGIVGIEELVATPSQRQVITLQPRPYDKDTVSGTLTCEFLFLERAEIQEGTLKSSKIQSENGTTITTTTYSKEFHNGNHLGQPDIAEAALRDLGGRQTKNPQQSTLIIHASRKEMDDDDHVYHRPSPMMAHDREESPNEFYPAISTGNSLRRFDNRNSLGFHNEVMDRGRDRYRKKSDFFGTLRRRLGRSKNRSHSMEPDWSGRDQSIDRDPLAGRSASVERARLESKGFLSVPGLRFRSNRQKQDSNSGTSSLSGTSGISSGSAKTYVNEASLMVVECLENGKVKHYLIPLSLQRKNKWRKRGTKLHIYNGHCFVARHMKRSTVCETCMKTLGRSIGKQGYECRDCALRCHKPCHVQTTMPCPNSSIDAMDLIHISDNQSSP